MAEILQNGDLILRIDLPFENYKAARFDQSGKISSVTYRGMVLTVDEKPEFQNDALHGKGLYNEFGIERALGFEAAAPGGWFHKIGVGLLKKEDGPYAFDKPYTIEPASFEMERHKESLTFQCEGKMVNGYGYLLTKTIALEDQGFSISYVLENTGEQRIATSEYVHNFFALQSGTSGGFPCLELPFAIDPERFWETVNPEAAISFGKDALCCDFNPKRQFFIDHLNGTGQVDAAWALYHPHSKLRVREQGDFKTNKVNLWGWRHVISPELFKTIDLGQAESAKWSRNYRIEMGD
ncbi:hypothetical protein ABV409_06215 [Flagellimonas sp. DF-77]|uniref:hypothetical protein n=1 Tax=Flagellimonas algarum TaxID=3230298 RepID=UPI00339952FA